MHIIISPAKLLNISQQEIKNNITQPLFIKEAEKLVELLKTYSVNDISRLMGINQDLAELNVKRYLEFSSNNTISKPAVITFNGPVFQKLNAKEFSEKEFRTTQNRLSILSGLYGILRPLDLIKPYRLEMGTKLKIENFKNLYDFWGDKITDFLNTRLEDNNMKTLINLASNEYFRSINVKKLKARVININFKELKNGQYKTLVIYTKQARGLMANFIIKNNLTNPEDLKHFDIEGYGYDENLSTENTWVFTR